MKNINLKDWILLIDSTYEQTKGEIQHLYNLKHQLDNELSLLFVGKLTTFYHQLFSIWDTYSLEAPHSTNYLMKQIEPDIAKLMNYYSDLLYFLTVVRELTGKEFDYPQTFKVDIWFKLKNKYVEDFISY